MTMEASEKARRQDLAATDTVEDWDQRHLPKLREPRSCLEPFDHPRSSTMRKEGAVLR